jgi:hypothetical protein
MTTWCLLKCFFVGLVIGAAASGCGPDEQYYKEREVLYQAKLKPFADDLKPGMKRRTVEGYLRSHDIAFERSCCTNERWTPSITVFIAKEKSSWFCDGPEHNVYISFQFSNNRPIRIKSNRIVVDEDEDLLEKIDIYHYLTGCL